MTITNQEVNMALDVQIYTRNLELTDRVRDYVKKKASKLDRYLTGIEEARVDLDYAKAARNAKDRQVAEITIRGRGFILRSEERSDDIFTAIDAVVDKMQRKIERFKGKRQRGRGDGRSAAEVVPVIESEPESDIAPVIMRRKRFVVTPIDEMEAIEQMRLLGHEDFFVFYNSKNNRFNVLYRRRDGTYGIIEPELG
jgi:putative sigma-54 modulation protein